MGSRISKIYQRLPALVRLFAWYFLLSIPVFLLGDLLAWVTIDTWSQALLAVSLFLFIENPLQEMGLSQAQESGVATVCALAFVIYLGWTVFNPFLESERLAAESCAPQTLEAQCYSLAFSDCQMAWDRFHQDCKKEVLGNLDPKRATALTGPQVALCTKRRFDHSFKSMRRIAESSACKNLFSSLDSQQ